MRVMPIGRERDQHGEVASTVLIVPVLLLCLLLVIQFALAMHARAVLTAAAQDGARAAQVNGGSAASGRVAASATLTRDANGLVHDSDVRIDDDGTTVTATVSADVTSIIPGWRWRVSGRASGPRETFEPTT
jgi:Flp pilus assembly protein TadG